MADFTINSLPTGSLGSGDNILKSNSDGALSKVSKEQLMTDLLGNSNYSAYGDTVSKALMNTAVKKSYTTVPMANFGEANVGFRRHGMLGNCYVSTYTTSAITDTGILATIPQGYRGDNVGQSGMGVAINGETVVPFAILIDGEYLKIAPVGVQIPLGSRITVAMTYAISDPQ